MPILKVISGHGGTGGIRNYLEKNGRALGRDFLNLPVEEWITEDRGGATLRVEWDAEMDATRRAYGTDAPWKGMRARTFKHFVISPDPEDAIDMTQLRELSQAWAAKHFGSHEVAIVYHDDNEGNIPHASEGLARRGIRGIPVHLGRINLVVSRAVARRMHYAYALRRCVRGTCNSAVRFRRRLILARAARYHQNDENHNDNQNRRAHADKHITFSRIHRFSNPSFDQWKSANKRRADANRPPFELSSD